MGLVVMLKLPPLRVRVLPFLLMPPDNVRVPLPMLLMVSLVPVVAVMALPKVALPPVYCRVPPARVTEPNSPRGWAAVAAPTALTLNTPALIAVRPPNVLMPVRVSVPVPVLVKASVPVVFWIIPPNVLVALLLPTVSIGVPPATVSTVPPPDKPLMVSLKVFRSRMPVTLMLPLPLPSGMTLLAPNCNMPALMMVSPV